MCAARGFRLGRTFGRPVAAIAASSSAVGIFGQDDTPSLRLRRDRRRSQFCSCSQLGGTSGVAAMSASTTAGTATSLVSDWTDPKKVMKLDKNYQTPDVVAQRRAMLSMLGLSDGQRVLDVGCGPGLMLQELAVEVGHKGRAEGVDTSQAMCDVASARLASVPNASVKIGSATELGFPDETFDAVVLSQVLLYVQDVPLALAEVRRVLRPGGRLIICDTDWDSLVVNTGDKPQFERIRTACCSTFVDAHLPPKLPGLLTSGGFTIDAVRTVPMIGAGNVPSDGSSFMSHWAFEVVEEKARSYGLPESEIRAWNQEQHALSQRGAFFACVHRFLFLACKPSR
eukprot:TRINITY_DN43215_c0_g1_i1.p1 TRINITY_DN43215_c0_g1~~TRINITY_DN43215_c0_g1_i1.p1  ORF type:complete len:366 (+),score=61.79 TRINITY_DN43215_c0_g1_i1:77-1099(+)